jgi:hypothetical protein
MLNQAWLWPLIWFFHTPGGQTFFAGRLWFGGTPSAIAGHGLFWTSVGLHFAVCLCAMNLRNQLERKYKTLQSDHSFPFSDRSLISLFGGGGLLGRMHKAAETKLELAFPPAWFDAFFILVALTLYWYWSVASLIVMLFLVVTGVLTEVVRMTFVYILHKRTFG